MLVEEALDIRSLSSKNPEDCREVDDPRSVLTILSAYTVPLASTEAGMGWATLTGGKTSASMSFAEWRRPPLPQM
jgi:hypothetical protein